MNTDSGQENPSAASVDTNAAETTLTDIECRVLGALMEKQLSTPDNYPLTINSLLSAVNQKSNREPVTNYQQGELVRTLRQLEERRFVRYEMGARSERYEQQFTHANGFSKKQQALLSVMMLRGPQTINELQSRTQRLYDYTDREDMVVSLERLTQGDNSSVAVIAPQAGQREARYAHLFCGDVGSICLPEAPATQSEARSQVQSQSRASGQAASGTEIEALKAEVAELRQQLKALYELTGHQLRLESGASDQG